MKVKLSFWIIGLLAFLLIPNGDLFAQQKDEEKKQVKKQSDLYLRAPGVVPGTLPEMRDVSYWISKMESPDEVILPLKEIERRNVAYRQRMAKQSQLDTTLASRIAKQIKSRPGLLAHIPDTRTITPTELAALTERMVKSGTDYLRSREFGNRMAIAYSEEELTIIENEISYNPKRQLSKSQTAITVAQSRLHIIPPIKPEYIGLFTNGKARWDLWNLDVLPLGTAVELLFTSKTGAFSFVLSERGYGWVASEEIALGSKSEINSFYGERDFIVCTGDRVPFYSDSDGTFVSGWLLMGDRLPLVGSDSRSVSIPFRGANGKFSVQEAWLRPDADVHVGYLPYTQKNAAVQAFKLLDNLYDWTGAWYGRNHATNLRDIFRSFGFELPANGILQSAFAENPLTIQPNVSREAQFKAIFANQPFLTLQVCENSHSQLYMGDHKGMPIGFDAHGYSYKDAEGNDLEIKRWVVGTIEMPDYFLKQEISFVRLY
jgi:hypothetical protein